MGVFLQPGHHRPFARHRHFQRVEKGLRRLLVEIGRAAVPELPADILRGLAIPVELRTERGIRNARRVEHPELPAHRTLGNRTARLDILGIDKARRRQRVPRDRIPGRRETVAGGARLIPIEREVFVAEEIAAKRLHVRRGGHGGERLWLRVRLQPRPEGLEVVVRLRALGLSGESADQPGRGRGRNE